MARRKRRRAWGSITTVTRDKHVLRWVENTPEGRKRRSKTFYGTYKEADLELARLRVTHADDGPVPTIGQAYEMWYLPWMEGRVASGRLKQRSLTAYLSCWHVHVEQSWAEVPVTEVRPMDVQRWVLGVPKGSAVVAMSILRAIGDFAVRYEVAAANKFRLKYEMPSEGSYKNRPGVLSLGEAERVLSELRGSLIEPPFILSCFGSARPGEACGVRAEEVSSVECCGVKVALVPVRRMMEDKGESPTPDGVLKNQQSVRTLVIPEPYGTRLLEITADGREWVSDRGDGLPLNTAALNSLWGSRPESSDVSFANLRKSWRTFAQYDWEVDYDTLELLMGHKLAGVTGKHYLKPSDEQLTTALAKAYAAFRERAER